MSKIEQIRTDMVQAMKAKDKDRKNTLSMLLSALKNAEIDKREPLTEAEEFTVIKKEIKQTRETIETAPAGRTDITEEFTKRLAVLSEYAPAEMSEAEIRAVIEEVLATLAMEALTARDKGRIMKELMPKVKGRADGKVVNEVLASMFTA